MRAALLLFLVLVDLLFAHSAYAQTIVPQNRIVLFDGTSLNGLYPWFSTSGFSDPDQVFRVERGMLHVTGNGWGALITNSEYRNFVMVLEFKWGSRTWGKRQGKAKDAGLLFHSRGIEGGWKGLLMPSIQAQMMDGSTGDVILLQGVDSGGATLPISVTSNVEQVASGVNPPNWNYREGYRWKPGNHQITINQDEESIHWSGWDPHWKDVEGYRGQTALESPDGHWNQLVVIADDDTFELFLNGTKVNEGARVVPSEGKLQLEVELSEFFVRRWELWPIGHAVGPIITVDTIPGGISGLNYSQAVGAKGVSALTWSIASGSLPPGLVLNPATGEINGTPTTVGTYSFSVRVKDAAGEQATQPLQIAVASCGGGLAQYVRCWMN